MAKPEILLVGEFCVYFATAALLWIKCTFHGQLWTHNYMNN